MCGIAGMLSFRDGVPSQDVLHRMARSMRHRGPDDEGFFCDGGLAFAFRRLSIIDLSGGRQPMHSPCGRYTIVFNGEIYNHGDVRRRLERDHGASFTTQSDTEVILAAHRQWGSEALSQLNGMFAFALWDAELRRLLLARDRLGKKPLYYAETPGGFCFASEVKVLFEHPELAPAVERRRLAAFLAYRYVPGDETLFRGVRSLPAGCWLTVSAAGGVAPPRRYWDYAFPDEARPQVRSAVQQERLRERLEELLSDSVRLRMISDVPFGAFLSGGIDSSLVVALMARQHPEPLKTFSIGFDTGFSETRYARDVAKRFGTDHHEITVGSTDLIAHIPKVLHARETPITEASDIPLYLLARLARRKVTVVLSGEGSDEIFAGYPKYAFERAWARSGGLLPGSVLRPVAQALPFALRRVQLALQCVSQADKLERYACWFGAFNAAERSALLSPELLNGTPLHAFSAELLQNRRFSSRVEEMLYLDTKHWLPANLLLRGDRMTMASSLELRCPFLDHRLVEFAARELPLSLKLRGLRGKWILRQLAAKLLPPKIVGRRKWGFKVPLDDWFRGALAPVLRDVLLSRRALARGYLREEPLRRLVEDHVTGRINYEKQLWILLQLELWHLMFIDRVLSPTDSLT